MNPTKKNLVPDGLFQALIDQYAEALIISDKNQRPHYWNSKAESLFGVDEENFCSNQQVLNKISSGTQQPRAPFETDIVRLSLPGLFEEQQFHRTIETLEINGEVWHFIRFTELSTFSLTESELYIQSRTDELSQLLNRRGFQSTLEHNIDKRLALAILDVDYFKRINDNHGHATGDRAIEWIAEQLNSEFTDAVCIGRLGGDEFGVVLEVANEIETKLRFERILQNHLSPTPRILSARHFNQCRRRYIKIRKHGVPTAFNRRRPSHVSIQASRSEPVDQCRAKLTSEQPSDSCSFPSAPQ